MVPIPGDNRNAGAGVQSTISEACEYCAHAFQVDEEVRKAEVPLLGEFDKYPSFRRLLSDGYQVLTF